MNFWNGSTGTIAATDMRLSTLQLQNWFKNQNVHNGFEVSQPRFQELLKRAETAHQAKAIISNFDWSRCSFSRTCVQLLMYIHCTINFCGKSSCRKICTDVRCTFASSLSTPYHCYVWKKKCEPENPLPSPIDIGLYKDFGELFQSDYMLFWEVF